MLLFTWLGLGNALFWKFFLTGWIFAVLVDFVICKNTVFLTNLLFICLDVGIYFHFNICPFYSSIRISTLKHLTHWTHFIYFFRFPFFCYCSHSSFWQYAIIKLAKKISRNCTFSTVYLNFIFLRWRQNIPCWVRKYQSSWLCFGRSRSHWRRWWCWHWRQHLAWKREKIKLFHFICMRCRFFALRDLKAIRVVLFGKKHILTFLSCWRVFRSTIACLSS